MRFPEVYSYYIKLSVFLTTEPGVLHLNIECRHIVIVHRISIPSVGKDEKRNGTIENFADLDSPDEIISTLFSSDCIGQ